jgi:hypothetical protein
MLIGVQHYRREADGDVIATILDGHGGTNEMRLSGSDADEVERVWNLNLFDLRRYERFPSLFPTPASIPVEISDATAA